MRSAEQHEHRTGVAAALAAFLAWGVMPGYFKLLATVGAAEIIAHRILWALPALLLFLLVRDRRALWRKMRLPPRLVGWLLLSGSLVAFNWLVFIWAVVNDQVLATSLGYFINPLVNVLLGFVFLHERLTGVQKVAVGLAAAGTVYLTWFLGQPPWISLLLAFSFGSYGLVRKRLPVGPMTGLMWEVLLLSLPALAYLWWRHDAGELDFLAGPLSTDFFIMLSGVVTIVPLIWFNVAAQRLSLTVLGFYQYIAPSMSFGLAVFLWHEPFTQGHAVAFACIWTALLLVSLEPLQRLRRGVGRG